MSRTVSATEARIHLGEHLHRVEGGNVITVQHDGTSLGVVVSIAEFQGLLNNEDQHENGWDLAQQSREAFQQERADPFMPSAVSLVGEDREERTAVDDGGDWRSSLARVRARMKAELGDKTIDFNQIIHDMREERSAELLDNLRRRQSRRWPD